MADGDDPRSAAAPLPPVLGRLRNARQALEVRQRGSSQSLIVRRYVSRILRRSSRRVGLERVLANQVFGGRGAGGGTVVWEVTVVWKERKSE